MKNLKVSTKGIILMVFLLAIFIGNNLSASFKLTLEPTLELLQSLKSINNGNKEIKNELIEVKVDKFRTNLSNPVDFLTNVFSKWIDNYCCDTLSLPDVFENSAFFSMNLQNGKVQKLSTIYRHKELTASYEKEMLRFSVPIGFSELKFKYDYILNFVGLKLSGQITAVLKDLKFWMDLLINSNISGITLVRFENNSLGSLQVKFSENLVADGLINFLSGILILIFKSKIRNIITESIKNSLQESINLINTALKIASE